ncbi:MAG TPA: DUF922 domain-containing protein [Beijerinckiaceae bacterium]|nr:DUF922 domain-containing protein [Beijerinckiaceae bacterium]
MRAAVLLVALFAAQATAQAAEIRTYVVRGDSAADLIQQMRQLGPRGFWGWTQADYAWTYRYDQSGGRCRIASATVTERIQVTLPSWSNRDAGKACLREAWERMLTRLSDHEQGHVSRWRGTRERIHVALLAIAPQASCDAVAKAADDTAKAEIRRTQDLQNAYDRQTNHGMALGVALPDC